MKWNCYLRGPRIVLRRVETSDLGLIAAWRNTPAIWRCFFNTLPIAHSQQGKWLKALRLDDSKLLFMIVARRTNRPIGTIGLDHIDQRNQSAEYGNLVIGVSEQRGRGFAREASALLLDFAFSRMNLRRISLYVFAGNQPAVRLYRSLGFKQEGKLRKAVYAEGRFKDLLLMAALKDDAGCR
ncbi:MAG: GNAT family N-acetyltransferase [Lentisphaerae bacterium]|nr:GNAT family N-acetyltransferase [Lentisphaerota bacterium]